MSKMSVEEIKEIRDGYKCSRDDVQPPCEDCQEIVNLCDTTLALAEENSRWGRKLSEETRKKMRDAWAKRKSMAILLIFLCLLSFNIFSNEGLTPEMIMSQMFVESRGDWGAVSREKCIGSMQISPVLAKEFGMPVHYLDHPVMGLDFGIRIMTYYWTMFHGHADRWEKALSCYNAGRSRTLRAIKRYGRGWRCGIPAETRSYIRKVMNRYKEER